MQSHKKNKSIQTGKEEIKLSLFVDDIIFYIENSNLKSIKQNETKQ